MDERFAIVKNELYFCISKNTYCSTEEVSEKLLIN